MAIRTTLGILVLLAQGLPAQTLEAALARMDRASVGFRGVKAQVTRLSHTAIINDTTQESGSITLFRPRPKDLRMLVEFTSPDERAVAYAGRKFQLYYPKLKVVQEYDMGRQGALIDQFVLLGFGTPGSEIARSYEVRHTGREEIGGVKCDVLELTPKSEEARKHVRKIQIWVAGDSGQPLQQRITQPSRDYTLITYSDLKVNPPLSEDSVKLKLPKGVKKETPQR